MRHNFHFLQCSACKNWRVAR